MEKMHIDVTSLAGFFISLFEETGWRYSCNRTKIGKLLSIVAFEYACNDKKLIDDDIYIYHDCGTSIPYATFGLDNILYCPGHCCDDKEYITSELNGYIVDTTTSRKMRDLVQSFCNSIEVPIVTKLDNDIIENLKSVFRRFGSYSTEDLGKMLCKIVDMQKDKSDGIVDLEQIKHNINYMFFSKDYKGNDIVTYLFFKQDKPINIQENNVKCKVKK